MPHVAVLSTYPGDLQAFRELLRGHSISTYLIESSLKTKASLEQYETPDLILCSMGTDHKDFLDLYYWLSNAQMYQNSQLVFVVDKAREATLEALSKGANVSFLYRPMTKSHLLDFLGAKLDMLQVQKSQTPMQGLTTVDPPTRLHGKIKSISIRKELGRGGSGVVYLGYQDSLARHVAVKVLSSELDISSKDVDRLRQEARILANLKHENIVNCYDAGVLEDNSFYIVMEYIQGQDVEQALAARGSFGEKEAASIIRQVAKGLAAAHQRNLIHRDIKPSNLLIDEHGHVTITDFGLAISDTTGRMTKTGVVMGTPYYLAPEQALNHELTPKVDIYALGIVFYELLTGVLPVEQDNIFQTVLQRLQEDYFDPRDKVPTLHPQLADLVCKMTQREPDKRMGSCQELFAWLDAFLGNTSQLTDLAPSFATPLPQSIKSSPLALLKNQGDTSEQSAIDLDTFFHKPSQVNVATPLSRSQANLDSPKAKSETKELDLAKALEQALQNPRKTGSIARLESGSFPSSAPLNGKALAALQSKPSSLYPQTPTPTLAGQGVASIKHQSEFEQYLQMAKKLYIQRDYQRSLQNFERCLAFSPHDKGVLSNIEKLRKRLQTS